MVILYNFALQLYRFAINVASFRSEKAEQWIAGREDWRTYLRSQVSGQKNVIWLHCASAGEFEQGKPVAEALKHQYPGHFLLISFFSPSGFAVAKRYAHANVICYLPLDTPRNANDFLDIVKPELALFVKYDYWYHFFNAISKRNIPLLMISAVFRPNQWFFKSWGKWFQQLLRIPQHFFLQDAESLRLAKLLEIEHASLSGDTRFDRVKQITHQFSEINKIAAFQNGRSLLVAGSTWREDEAALGELDGVRMIIAPHEIHEEHLRQLENTFNGAIRYSAYQPEMHNADVLIIDNVGMLSQLYHYADITYVGGGFSQDGIHNILEAAVWGKPVIIGPNYKKYREASEMMALGGCFSIREKEALKALVIRLLTDDHLRTSAGQKAKAYIDNNVGATKKIIEWIQENRLLTSS